MITAGIDMGSATIKAVILKDGKVLAQNIIDTGREKEKLAKEALDGALKKAKLSLSDVEHIGVTGVGYKIIPFADKQVTVVGADAKGALYLFPSVRTVIDIGAEEGRAIKCTPDGRIVDFAINEKCAAGAGSFTESMSRAIELSVQEFAKVSLESTQSIPLNAQCAVFAESEVVGLIHAKTSKADIARAVHDGISARISAMARTVGLGKDVLLIGGMARNVGLVASLNKDLELEVMIPKEPEFIGAIGAALSAAE
ncbi:MAG: CoA activase [Chloroflexi bacterium]|nr:CoA activase [Chloroflexota bacterium]MBI3930422.1 CoA activase [Chloroflexota bacterium]